MDLPTSLPRITAWRRFLLEDPLPPDLPSALPAFLKTVHDDFLRDANLPPGAVTSAVLDLWYCSREGQQTLAAFAEALWEQMLAVAGGAMPAHDTRHAMFKVPAASLEYMAAEQVDGWHRLGLLGALLHDYGRWAEERIFGGPGGGIVHGTLSLLLGQELLQRYPMPRPAREQLLLAALRHTAGAVAEDVVPLKLTVAADRDQLYGPEIVLRLLHHLPGPGDDMSSIYGDLPGRPVLDRWFYFLANRLPGPLYSRDEHVGALWSTLATVVLRCEDADASRSRFSSCQAFSRSFAPGASWESAWEAAQQHCHHEADVEAAAKRLLTAPNVASDPWYLEIALQRVRAVPESRRAALASALAFAERAREEEDARQHDALLAIRREFASDALVRALADRLLAGWNGATAAIGRRALL